MKKIIFLLLFVLSFIPNIFSQNIVINGEFTNLGPNGQPCNNNPDIGKPFMLSTHDCPEIEKALGWSFGYAQNSAGDQGTADLYSVGATNSIVNIPTAPNCGTSNKPCHYFENPPGSSFDLNKNYSRFRVNLGEGDNIMKGESLLGSLSTPLQPGETYLFRCAVAAGSDNNFMVQFRESNNPSTSYLTHTISNVGNNYSWEYVQYTFTVPQNVPTGLDKIELGGYRDGTFPNTIAVDRVFLEPLWDGIDYPLGITICQGESGEIPLYNNPNYTYSWSPSNTLSDLTIANPIASPLTTTTYTCEVSYGIQSQVIQITVEVSNGPTINLSDIFISCDGNYEQICAPSGPNYTYEWFGPVPGGNTSELLWGEQCFIPEQTGSYLLTVIDQYGCESYHNFTVLDQIPIPILADGDQICIGDSISIYGQGFDNPNFVINWYHNGGLVQTGGTLLQTSFTSGYVTVQVSHDSCEPVSTSIQIIKCCPEDIELSVNCENQTIVIENLPANWPVAGMEWTFNGTPISPQPPLTSILNASFGEGTYGVIILYSLENGKYCKIKVSVEYNEADCCDEVGPIANAHFENILDYQTTHTDPYGDIDIPVLCDFILDASASICEEEYTFSISELDPLPWTITEVFPWTNFSGQAGSNIDLSQFMSFIPGQAYLLAFNVGPNGTTAYLPFIYGLDAEVEITNISGYISVPGTQYGDLEVPIVRCGLRLDGSASSCEDSYQVKIESFDPNTWSTTPVPGEIYNVWTSGQAPNTTFIPSSTFPNNGFYLLTFAVGPTWTADYELFYYECDHKKGSSKIDSRYNSLDDTNSNITLYPNPTNDLINLKTSFDSGTYQMYDVNGKTLLKGEVSSKETSIDLSTFNAGVYFIQIQSGEGKVHFEKVIKN